MAVHLKTMDDAYETGEARRYLSLSAESLGSAERGSIADLAAWAAARVGEAP